MSLDEKYLLFCFFFLVGLLSLEQVLEARFSKDLDDQKQVIRADYRNFMLLNILLFFHFNCHFNKKKYPVRNSKHNDI